jgi:hypothetical protein
MLNILLEEEYGYIPPRPDIINFKIDEKPLVNKFCAGKATLHKITAVCTFGEKIFSFPFYRILPTKKTKHPFFIHINFRPDVPDRYQPTEELVDNGFAVLSFCYNDVTKDNDDFTDGLAGILYENGKRNSNDCGKIAMWAWAAQRVMDYAETLSNVLDLDCAIVCGHSRLGKTALLAAATDERFKFAHSNDSGCSGAAITRGKVGEQLSNICKVFPYWFCENYLNYAKNDCTIPFDQHYLIASIAPRYVSIASAIEDTWADPNSEFLACVASSESFENGFICEDRLPIVGDIFFEGDIGYQLRDGTHYFSREDWLKLIHFINKKYKGINQ